MERLSSAGPLATAVPDADRVHVDGSWGLFNLANYCRVDSRQGPSAVCIAKRLRSLFSKLCSLLVLCEDTEPNEDPPPSP
jgi:hypothetical protein